MHHFLCVIFPLLAIIGLQFSVSGSEEGVERTFIKTLTVNNGLNFGSWGENEFCPRGTLASGFSLRVEKSVFSIDDTALNGIRLHCVSVSRDSLKSYEVSVQSDCGKWGEWTDIKWCPAGYLTGFQLNVEKYKEFGDNTAANNIRFMCSDGSILEGEGRDWGDWGKWSGVCVSGGVCGIQTRVEEPQGVFEDDTALNDARMFCCD